ncbi:14915_t:CDS:2 [Funneliformis caledonium]|uniref:14915_t:CDS:1 n=1 Tax=Funneliformis caledonium TaxID=1117310 RepID=A0A9N9EMN8_9GLOM|nr:14915_t:CDS:2 [Funneliformis caledonium]
MKDVILIDLQENDLHSLNAYIKAINTVMDINPFPKKKCEEKNDILLVAMKMLKTQLRHLPLGFNNPIKILACGYTYHRFCYSNNRFKCLHCLSFLCNGIDEHVQSLLKSLQKRKEQVIKPESNIPCDDNDDESELIKYIAYALEEALHKFQQQ